MHIMSTVTGMMAKVEKTKIGSRQSMGRFVLAATFLSLLSAVAGCNSGQQDQDRTDHGDQFVVGTVVKIDGTLPRILNSTINLHVHSGFSDGYTSGETVKIGEPTYLIYVKTKSGVYLIQLDDRSAFTLYPEQSVDCVASVIEIGTKVRFPRVWYSADGQRFEVFSPSKIGNMGPGAIEIIAEK